MIRWSLTDGERVLAAAGLVPPAGGALLATVGGKFVTKYADKVGESIRRYWKQLDGQTRKAPCVADEVAETVVPNRGMPQTFGKLNAEGFTAPKISTNRHGQLTNGKYTLDTTGMSPHTTGSLAQGKSQFLYRVNEKELVLDAAAYADEAGLWVGNKAKIVFDRPLGVHARTGQQTTVLNIYRNKNGFIHASPGTPQ